MKALLTALFIASTGLPPGSSPKGTEAPQEPSIQLRVDRLRILSARGQLSVDHARGYFLLLPVMDRAEFLQTWKERAKPTQHNIDIYVALQAEMRGPPPPRLVMRNEPDDGCAAFRRLHWNQPNRSIVGFISWVKNVQDCY